MTIKILLTCGLVTLIDDCDADLASLHWYHDSEGYVVRQEKTGHEGKRVRVALHRLILERKLGRQLEQGELTDHANGTKTDNRRANLRLATQAQNSQNKRTRQDSRTGIKGVHWSIQHQRWRAHISVGGKRKHLGLFDTVEAAAEAYKEAALQYFGEFARFE